MFYIRDGSSFGGNDFQSRLARLREVKRPPHPDERQNHRWARIIAAFARGLSGVQIRWQGCTPEMRQRIICNTPAIDFVVLWSALPVDYARERVLWQQSLLASRVPRFLAQRVFRAVLVERRRRTRELRTTRSTRTQRPSRN